MPTPKYPSVDIYLFPGLAISIACSNRMKGTELAQIFRTEVPRPTKVEGDAWGLDATTEDILRLIEADPDDLIADSFSGYLGYCTTGGDDDLRFLFPSILRIWESALYERDSWFTQYFHAEVCRTDFVERALSPRLREATYDFIIRPLSDRLGSETSLSVKGVSTSHDWFGYVASFGVFTTAIPALWSEIWESERAGHAIALLQYLSCLIYDGSNPIFAPWTCEKGGGPPELWGFDSVGFDESWKSENVDFMSTALAPGRISVWLERTSTLHSDSQISEFSDFLLDEFAGSAREVDERIRLLLIALQTPSGVGIVTWDSLRGASGNLKS